jgi:rusticyanin
LKNSTILAIVLLVIGIGSLFGVFLYGGYGLWSNQQVVSRQPPQQQYPPAFMGGYGGGNGYGYGGMMGQGPGTASVGQPVTIEQAIQTMQTIPSYARVIPNNNTIIFESQQFSVFALALMPDKAVNLTGRQPPSYATDDVFVIYGLINPTIIMPSGASVQFTVVNLDDDMYHNLVVSVYGPPYGYMSMQGMMSGGWMPYLPPADYSEGSAHEYSYTLTMNEPGTLSYICTYPEHAESGMYGKIIVTD